MQVNGTSTRDWVWLSAPLSSPHHLLSHPEPQCSSSNQTICSECWWAVQIDDSRALGWFSNENPCGTLSFGLNALCLGQGLCFQLATTPLFLLHSTVPSPPLRHLFGWIFVIIGALPASQAQLSLELVGHCRHLAPTGCKSLFAAHLSNTAIQDLARYHGMFVFLILRHSIVWLRSF